MVIGVDMHRLARHSHYQNNEKGQRYWVVRADLIDFGVWPTRRWELEKHCILYPNPWPKAAHLSRRWHGSPVWKNVVELGGQLHMRSNWSLYLLEVTQALMVSGYQAQVSLVKNNEEVMTPFERKYKTSGQPLWQLDADLSKET